MDDRSASNPEQQRLLLLKKAGDDLASLRRVSHRLALTEDDKLGSVLDKLLPRLLKRVGENHQLQASLRQPQPQQQGGDATRLLTAVDAIHKCLVEMFSHILQRVKADASLPLPCAGMASQLLDALILGGGEGLPPKESQQEEARQGDDAKSASQPASNAPPNQPPDSLFVNLTLTLLTVGAPRLGSNEAIVSLAPLLIRGWIPLTRMGTEQQLTQWVHLLLACWERGDATPAEASANGVANNKFTGAERKAPALNDGWGPCRALIGENDLLSALAYDLLLDALLYAPPPLPTTATPSPSAASGTRTDGVLPPDGLSQAGFARLAKGPPTTSANGVADWGAEVAQSPVRRAQLKQRLLDAVAPSRSYQLLLGRSASTRGDAKREVNNEASASHYREQQGLGLARTLALLLVGTGDSQSHVQERAASYWKIYRDSQQQRSAALASTAPSIPYGPADSFACVIPLLCVELLSLCLGQAQAEASLSSLSSRGSAPIGALPLSPPPLHDIQRWIVNSGNVLGATPPASIVWASKRRPVSEAHAMALLEFVAKALEEHPQAWNGPVDDDGGCAEEKEADDCLSDPALLVVATLGVRVARSKLEAVSVSGLTVQRARPQIVAARLLRAIATRLAVRWDRVGIRAGPCSLASTGSTTILAPTLALACSVLKGVAQRRTISPSAAAFGDEGNIEVRDACYGVVCTVSRSCAFGATFGSSLFVCGDTEIGPAQAATSVRTVELLFRCVCQEEERLRPRALAALDALLGAYQQVWVDAKPDVAHPPAASNPWSNLSEAVRTSTASEESSDQAAIDTDRSSLARSLLPLLWSAAQTCQPKASRVAAARWTSDLVKHLDLPGACHLLCFLAGDTDSTAASIAMNGLGVASTTSPSSSSWILPHVTSDQPSKSKLPSFSAVSRAIFGSSAVETPRTASSIQRYWDFSFRGKAAALRFGIACLLSDLYDNELESTEEYLSTLCETLRLFMQKHAGPSGLDQGRWSVDLLDDTAACLRALLAASSFSRTKVLHGDSGITLKDVEELTITVSSSNARRDLSHVCGLLYESFDFWDSQQMVGKRNLNAWAAESGMERTLTTAVTGLLTAESHGSTSKTVHGCAHLGASAARAFRFACLRYKSTSGSEQEMTWQTVSSILQLLGRGTKLADDAVANACVDGLEIVFSYDGADAPPLDIRLYQGCATALHELADSMIRFGNGEHADPRRTSRLARAAGAVLAATGSVSGVETNGDVATLSLSRAVCVTSLFNLFGSSSFRKDDEIGLGIGEALAAYADCTNDLNLASMPTLTDWPSDYSDDLAARLPAYQHVTYVLVAKMAKSSSPHERNACAPALLALVARVARGVHNDSKYSRRGLCMEIHERLDKIQLIFLQLLADSKIKHLPRECCCLGLAACRGIAGTIDTVKELEGNASDAFNDRLLRAFGQSTMFSTSAYMETAAQAAARRAAERRANIEDEQTTNPLSMEDEDNVGGTAGMSEASLGAYREMAAASVALGRHDIFYWLLVLSVTHPCWSDDERRTRYSPRCLLGESASFDNGNDLEHLQRALRPHLGKLIPRILRAKYDPNKQTRDQMSALWIGLTGGGAASREILSDHLLSTIDILVQDSTSKLWRTRTGACGALAEILVGRTWDELGGGGAVLTDDADREIGKASAGHLMIQLWNITMRAVDDVRGAVRDVGLTLGRGVRSLTIRLCNPNATDLSSGGKRGRDEILRKEKNAMAASATALRWLIRHGLGQQCAEAAGLCVSTLVEVVGTAHPTMLGPILPDLLRSMLLAISALEPAALNYLQLKLDDKEGLERLRLQLAQSGPMAMAVTKCLDVIPLTDSETQHATVSQLEAALRLSAGFATRAAVADSVTALCSSCPSAFRFSSTSSGNPSVRLLRGLYFASERERTSAAKDKMIHALGNLAALCPGSSVRALVIKACERYVHCTGNNDDAASRKAAASAIRAIIVRSDHLADAGNFDVWRTRVLPVAFLGRKDDDEKIASMWQDVWNEAGAVRTGDESAQRHFGSRMEEVLLPYLVSESLRAVQDVSWSRRRSGAMALRELCEIGVLAPLASSKSTSGSPGDIQRDQCRSEASGRSLIGCLRVVSQPRFWKGKVIVLKAAVELASKWINLCVFDESSSTESLWKPISVQLSSGTENDLFLGDKWFSHTESDISSDEIEDIPMAIDFTDRSNQADDSGASDWNPESDTGDSMKSVDVFAVVPSSDQNSQLLLSGFVRLLLVQASQIPSANLSDEALPYRIAALQGLQLLMTSLAPCPDSEHVKQILFNRFKGDLFAAVSRNHIDSPPVITAGFLGVLGSMMWQGVGHNHSSVLDEMMTSVSPLALNHAWTVREASSLCLASLSSCCTASWLRQHRVVSALIKHAQETFRERKFWRVRLAGIKIIECLARRTGDKHSSNDEAQLVLESLLPHKDAILRLLNSSLKDSEPQVSAAGSQVLISIVWWP